MKKKPLNKKTAIALHYDEKNAPQITAKGRGSVADEILALAEQHNIPLHQDKELTALLSQLELGEEIPQELYIAVAEVLAFAYMLMGRVPAKKADKEEK